MLSYISVFGICVPHLVMLKIYSCLCAQQLLLMVLGRIYEVPDIEKWVAKFKAQTLVLSSFTNFSP